MNITDELKEAQLLIDRQQIEIMNLRIQIADLINSRDAIAAERNRLAGAVSRIQHIVAGVLHGRQPELEGAVLLPAGVPGDAGAQDRADPQRGSRLPGFVGGPRGDPMRMNPSDLRALVAALIARENPTHYGPEPAIKAADELLAELERNWRVV